jgi:MFS family permease
VGQHREELALFFTQACPGLRLLLAAQQLELGALLGPPLAAALVVSSGWRGVGPVYLMTAAVSALLIVLAARAPEMRPTASARRVHG